MNPASYTPEPKLLSLLGKLCAEDIAVEESSILLEHLQADAKFREFYVGYLSLHAELMWSTVSRQIPADAVPWTDELLVPVRRRPSFWFSPSWLAMAATLMLAAYFVGLPALIGLDRAWRMAAGVFNEDRQSRSIVATESVATVRGTHAARWSPTSTPLVSPGGRGAGGEGAAVKTSQPLQLDGGLVELQLKQGTTLLIEGPARWTIDGDNAATLSRGKLVAHVPPQAIGFTLEIPSGTIVDLGTEFGVEVVPGGTAEVQVFAGQVEVRTQQVAGQPKQITRLNQGQAWRLSRGSAGIAIAPDDSKFVFRRAAQVKGIEDVLIEDSGPLLVASVADSHFTPANDDLLQTSLDKRLPHRPAVGSKGNFDEQLVEYLFNGRLYPPGEDATLHTTQFSYSAANSQPIEFFFDTMSAPHGYDIERIETITGWVGNRIGQRYLVVFRRKGSNQFETASPIHVDIAGEDSDRFFERKITIRGRDGQPLASGVDAVGIVLLERSGDANIDIYREIDVFGHPSAAARGRSEGRGHEIKQ